MGAETPRYQGQERRGVEREESRRLHGKPRLPSELFRGWDKTGARWRVAFLGSRVSADAGDRLLIAVLALDVDTGQPRMIDDERCFALMQLSALLACLCCVAEVAGSAVDRNSL
jgi:hypothetical protein